MGRGIPPSLDPIDPSRSVRTCTWTMPPSHPEWAPGCPTPCEVRLKVPLLAAIYYHFVEAFAGYASWCALGTLAQDTYMP